ncbi:MAG TPA: restriction endonuclease subunit S [Pseudosphingobacterium sp.]|nr:restriction endonuclease subunit S [Pseudosphingobacterium sp.]
MEKSLPKGWVNLKIGDLCIVERGGSPRPISKFLTDEMDGINWIKISDGSNSNKYILATKERIKKEGKSKSRYVQSGDLLLSNSMSFGRPYILKTDGCIHDGWLVLKKRISNSYDNEFLYYLLSSDFLYSQFNDLASGSTVRNLNKELVSSCTLTFPPLPEQERIVAKLDKLFAQHEKIKKALDRIPQLLKVFRQQVLTQAVTGKLTEQWREGKKLNAQAYINGVLSKKKKQVQNKQIKKEKHISKIKIENILHTIPDDWVTGKLGEITSFSNGDRGKNYPNREEYVDEGIAFINTGHILRNGYLDANSMNYITQEKFDSLSGGKIEKNDLVYCLRGATLGKTALVEQFEKGAIASSLVLIRPIENVSKWFLYYFLVSPIGRKYIKEFDNGSAQPNLSAENVRNYIIGIPHFHEQQEIVHRVNSLFAKADAIETRYQELKLKIDKLAQAILHKAFKGELVPQLSTDGDAKDLLAEIMALKKETKR